MYALEKNISDFMCFRVQKYFGYVDEVSFLRGNHHSIRFGKNVVECDIISEDMIINLN